MMSCCKICNNDIDSDNFLKFSNSVNKCHLKVEFNCLVHDNHVEYNFSLLHFNAPSLAKNLYQLIVYLETLNCTFHVIVGTRYVQDVIPLSPQPPPPQPPSSHPADILVQLLTDLSNFYATNVVFNNYQHTVL